MSGRILSEAERQEARYRLLTTTEVAERLSDEHITGDTVRRWCMGGWLRHVDIRRPGARSGTYMVEWSWAEDFVRRGGARAFTSGAVEPFWWESHAA